MSTISLPYEKQIRHFFVADALATETTAKDFVANASVGEMQIFDQNGNAVSYNSGELIGKDLYLLKKNQKGGVSRTDLITPKDITYLRGTSPVAKVGRKQEFTLSAAPTKGKHYFLNGKVNYGTSEENFISFYASAKAKDGETTTALLTRLAKQMADNLANSIHTKSSESDLMTIISGTTAKKNKYFNITVSGSTLTIQEKDWILSEFKVGLKTMDQLLFNFELQAQDDEQDNVTKSVTAPVFAKGQGYQMIELERYLVGHRAETTPFVDSTLGFGREYDVNINSQYYALDLKYFDISRDSEKHSDKMLTIVSTDPKVIDRFGFAIESAMGKTEGQLWTELDPAADGADDVV